VFLAGRQSEAAKIGEPVPEELNRRAQVLITESQRAVARDVSASLDKQVRAALAESIAEGDTGAERVARVREILTDAEGYVADRIARTETATAYVQGRNEEWRESGRVVAREWLLSGNPCPICRGLAGKIVPLDQPFVRAGEQIGNSGIIASRDIWNVPAHPNCSCDEAAIFKSENDA
jgi:SPP1 gp7 family putative phage head morphogenesis protein